MTGILLIIIADITIRIRMLVCHLCITVLLAAGECLVTTEPCARELVFFLVEGQGWQGLRLMLALNQG